MWKKCYELELGQTVSNIPNAIASERLTRVPGGWVYTYGDMAGTSTIFIPFDNEFVYSSKSIPIM